MNTYFEVEVRPEIPIASLIQNDKTDLPFSAGDLFWDWQEFEVPGTVRLVSLTAIIRGEDGSPQTDRDLELIFAKTKPGGTAPISLGTPNATVNGKGYVQQSIGFLRVDISDMSDYLDYYTVATIGAAGQDGSNRHLNIVMQPESTSRGATSKHKLYVGGIAGASNTWDFSTGTLLNQAGNQAVSTTPATLTVDGTSALQSYCVGDVLAAAGGSAFKTVGTVTAVTDANTVVVDAVAEAFDDDLELVVINPITLRLGFEA